MSNWLNRKNHPFGFETCPKSPLLIKYKAKNCTVRIQTSPNTKMKILFLYFAQFLLGHSCDNEGNLERFTGCVIKTVSYCLLQ